MTPEARTALERLGKDMAQQRKEAEAQAAREKLLRAAAEREAALFRQAVQDAAPLRAPKRVERPTPRPMSLPASRPNVHNLHEEAPARPDATLLAPLLSDGVDYEAHVETDQEFSYLRAGFAPNTLKKLRRGDWPIQDHLDLHGLTRDEAREAVARFLADAVKRGLRCVRIVHGKGLGSSQRVPVLKSRVHHWLRQSEAVLGFVQAGANHGGAGAVLALLAGQAP
jgi:DNA-nicking Smr family endonuclease